MFTTVEIDMAERRIDCEYSDDELVFELWSNDNVRIVIKEYDNLLPKDFQFEMTKENAIRLAEIILAVYRKHK